MISFVGDIGPKPPPPPPPPPMLAVNPTLKLVEVMVLFDESMVSVRESRPLRPRELMPI